MSAKVDTITIKIIGTKDFRQKIIDLIYKVLIDDEIQIVAMKSGNGFTLDSSIPPSEEVEI